MDQKWRIKIKLKQPLSYSASILNFGKTHSQNARSKSTVKMHDTRVSGMHFARLAKCGSVVRFGRAIAFWKQKSMIL